MQVWVTAVAAAVVSRRGLMMCYLYELPWGNVDGPSLPRSLFGLCNVCVDGIDDTLEYGGHNVVGELEGLPETWLVVSKLWRSIGSVTAR